MSTVIGPKRKLSKGGNTLASILQTTTAFIRKTISCLLEEVDFFFIIFHQFLNFFTKLNLLFLQVVKVFLQRLPPLLQTFVRILSLYSFLVCF